MAIDGSVHCHTGNTRVVGFFGLEPKSVGAAVDLVVDLNRLFPVGRHLSPTFRWIGAWTICVPADAGRPGRPQSTTIPISPISAFARQNPERLWRIMICYRVGNIGTEPIMGPGDAYRLRAADMLAKAEQNERYREDLENLAMAYLRLAEQADRNAKLGQPLEPDDPAVHQKQQWGADAPTAAASATTAAQDETTD